MKTNAIEVEDNWATSGKLKAKEKKAKRKMKAKEESSSSSKNKEKENKIDEITSLLRILSNHISRMENQPRVAQHNVNRPPMQYNRPFQPQILQR